MKKVTALVLVLCLMLTGCQLAVDETKEDGFADLDRLVGVVVTTEYLDLFDMDAWLEDNLEEIMEGKDTDTRGYEQRIWAQEEVEQSMTEDGVTGTTVYYNFDHVDGIQLLHYEARTILEDGSLLAQFHTGTCDDGLWSVSLGGEWNEGTIYMPLDAPQTVFYLNPVYQDGEGRLYLVSGSGLESSEFAGSMSQTIRQERTVTIDGEQTVEQHGFKITIEGKTVCQSVTVIQMSKDHKILDQITCSPEKLPPELAPMAECAYLLVEESADGVLTRILLQPGDMYYTAYIRSDAVYCTGKTMEIHWPED